MKQINEKRIIATSNYIKDYYARKGIYPTYRDIQKEVGYTSLSLVSADIKKLKDRGILVDDSFKHVKLISKEEEHIVRYNFPFIITTDAGNHLDRLNDDERKLYTAQSDYLKGDYESSKKLCFELLESSKEESILFGVRLTLCWDSLYTGEVIHYREFFRMLLRYDSKNKEEKMEKELIAHFFSSLLRSKDNIPTWLTEGRFYNLRKEAYPLATLCFMVNAINSNPPVEPHNLEPICSYAAMMKLDIIQVYMDLYLAIAYHYSQHDEYLKAHLDGAIKTCLKNGWYTPLAEVSKTLGGPMEEILEEYDEEVFKKIKDTAIRLATGYNKLYESLVGQSVTKDLTFREVEVINFIRMGKSNKEIADKLFLSPETVKYYLSSIYLKLGISSRNELKGVIEKFILK